jgi:hypothetical protein
LKKVLEAVLVITGTVIGIVGQVVLLAATVTVQPISNAWHSGRLAAERRHAVQSQLDQLAATLSGLTGKVAESESSTGAYL